MTLSGFFLNQMRPKVGTAYIESLVSFACCSSVAARSSLVNPDTSAEFEMVCPNSSSSNCHSKMALYAAGILIGGAAIGYFIGRQITKKKARCNDCVKLSTDKVVDTVDIEDIGEKKAYCRCWKSKKFPYCDGSHNAHNNKTGDNVGPLVVKGKAAA